MLPAFADQTDPNAHQTTTVYLRKPPQGGFGDYIHDFYTKVYRQLGINIKWIETGSVREFDFVAQGKLTGTLARARVIETQYPELIRVPSPVLAFKLLKVSDRMRCGFCLDKDVRSIAYGKNMIISEIYANGLPSNSQKFPISSPEKLNQIIQKRRVDSILIMDFQLNDNIKKDPHFLVDEIEHQLDYHYLSPNNAHLLEPLDAAIKQLIKQGEINKISTKFKISQTQEKPTPIKINRLNAIANHWQDYTNKDGSGVYWQIIETLFGKSINISKTTIDRQNLPSEFAKEETDILVGAVKGLNLNNALFSHYHIDFEYPLIILAQDKKHLAHYLNKDSSIKACTADNASSVLEQELNFITRKNIITQPLKQCEKLLQQNKVDLIISYQYHIPNALKHYPQLIIREQTPLFLAFKNNKKGQYLRFIFDHRIKEMAKSNLLQAIYPSQETYQQAHITKRLK